MRLRRRGKDFRKAGLWAASALITLFCCARCTPIADIKSATGPEQADRDAEIDAAISDASCRDDGDCPSVTSACASERCTHGVCVTSKLAEGTVLPDVQQVAGDCQRVVCDAHGNEQVETDDSDTADSDGNPCHVISCSDGVRNTADRDEGSSCNRTGVCRSGKCSVCPDGDDCTGAHDCTVHKIRCDQGMQRCDDTGEPAPAKACDVDKICDNGVCTACVVGDACMVSDVCHVGRVTRCDGARVCESKPQTGDSCGSDSSGNPLFCEAGVCTAPCQEGACASGSDPCQSSHWDCTKAGAPRCVMSPSIDGTSCGADASCHAGVCKHAVLANGGFARGLDGWSLTGDAPQFFVGSDTDGYNRMWVTTSVDGKSGSDKLTGTLSQAFKVPSDALAIRFYVFGGHAHVRLRDDAGNMLEDCVGIDSNTTHIPVSWDLTGRRGQTLTIALEDDLADGAWAFISSTGFDIVRDVPGPLRNPQFADRLTGWDATGDGALFNVYEDYNYSDGIDPLNTGISAYGRRRSVSTYVRDTSSSHLYEAGTGTLSQTFLVPPDAVALRFNLCGGRPTRVVLQDGSTDVDNATPNDNDSIKVPINWDLTAYRGKMLRLQIEDFASSVYGYLGTSGFDLITSSNGP